MANIICADDEPYVQRVYQKILAAREHEVRICSSGSEVLAEFARQPADLVLLDLLMPGISGLETCQELRKRPDAYNVPIIMVSGVDEEDSISDCLQKGADDYILKPFKPSEILAKIAVALKKHAEKSSGDLGLHPGVRFAGRFDIVREVGAGGFSTVYLAIEVAQSRNVALKVFALPPSKRNNQQVIASFLREAYELAKLDYHAIVKFYDFGRTNNLFFLAMEYLDGQCLDDVVEKHGALDEGNVVLIGYEVARAIRYLSRVHIVHRDIKPANIMLSATGDVKLLDFGLAKTITDVTLTMGDEIRATPSFAAPESFGKGATLDVKSDVYSLGATLYYAATGQEPFCGETVMEIIASHFRQRPDPVNVVNPKMSPQLGALIQSMLNTDREQRPDIFTVTQVLREMLHRFEQDNAN